MASFVPQTRKQLKTAVDSCAYDAKSPQGPWAIGREYLRFCIPTCTCGARTCTLKVLEKKAHLPKRNKDGKFVFPDYPRFKPNLSPEQVCEEIKMEGPRMLFRAVLTSH